MASLTENYVRFLAPRALGYQSLFDALNYSVPSYPPYDIVAVSDNEIRVDVAAAGFKKEELEVTFNPANRTLVINGKRKDAVKESQFYHRGIGRRTFSLGLPVADNLTITESKFVDGILSVSLVRKEPTQKEVRIDVK